MAPRELKVISLSYRRPGLNHIKFIADYGSYKRRGILIYDTVSGKFLSHTSDIKLILMVCQYLQTKYTYSSV